MKSLVFLCLPGITYMRGGNMPLAKELVFIVEFVLYSRHILLIKNLYSLISLLFIPPQAVYYPSVEIHFHRSESYC